MITFDLNFIICALKSDTQKVKAKVKEKEKDKALNTLLFLLQIIYLDKKRNKR